MGNDWSASRSCDCVNGCYEKDKEGNWNDRFEIEYQQSYSSYDDFRSCCSDDGFGGHSHHCPFPKSEMEARTEGIDFEDLAKLQNYFDLEAHWSEDFATVTPGGVDVKQYSQCGLFGYDEYVTVVHAPGQTSEKYFASQADLQYMCDKNDMVTEHEILWHGVHQGMHRTTQFQNLLYPYIGAQRQYVVHADCLPRKVFPDFPHLCYCKSTIGIPNECASHFEKVQQYTLCTSYMKWVCWDEADGLHIVSWIGEDPGWFASVVRRIQPQMVPGALDGAMQATDEYPEDDQKEFMNTLIDRLEAHGIEIPEKPSSLPAPRIGPPSPSPPRFLTENSRIDREETFKSSIDQADGLMIKLNPDSPRRFSNDTTIAATIPSATPRNVM